MRANKVFRVDGAPMFALLAPIELPSQTFPVRGTPSRDSQYALIHFLPLLPGTTA